MWVAKAVRTHVTEMVGRRHQGWGRRGRRFFMSLRTTQMREKKEWGERRRGGGRDRVGGRLRRERAHAHGRKYKGDQMVLSLCVWPGWPFRSLSPASVASCRANEGHPGTAHSPEAIERRGEAPQ